MQKTQITLQKYADFKGKIMIFLEREPDMWTGNPLSHLQWSQNYKWVELHIHAAICFTNMHHSSKISQWLTT